MTATTAAGGGTSRPGRDGCDRAQAQRIRGDGSTVKVVIRDVTELRELGQVYRRVADLDVDLDTWRAGMRRAARREGIRIRTFVVEPAPSETIDDLTDGLDDLLRHAPPDTASPAALVYAVRTDHPPAPDTAAATLEQLAADRRGATAARHNTRSNSRHQARGDAAQAPASVTSLSDARARRTGHPCAAPDLG